MSLRKIFMYYFIIAIFFVGCAKKTTNMVKDLEDATKNIATVKIESEIKISDKKKKENKDIRENSELIPTNEGFSYGEWYFLRGINNYLPDYSGNFKWSVLESKVWILKGDEEFNPDSPADQVLLFNVKGKRIKNISYTRDVSGNIYKYDETGRLISIVPIVDGSKREKQEITLKYFKMNDGNKLRKNYQSGILILDEIESKTESGWVYSWKKPDQKKYQKVELILYDDRVVEYLRYYASGGGTKYTLEYSNGLLTKVSTIDEGDKIPYQINEYFYNKDGLLEKEEIFDPREKSKNIIRTSIYSDYDSHKNWRKEFVTFNTGGKEIVIREFTYPPE